MRLDLFNEQVKKIGAEIAEEIGEKFDESHILIETNTKENHAERYSFRETG